jgi:hypothetical protein
MQTTIKPMIADWYDVKHFEDWQHETVKSGEEYYLIEPIKGYVDIVPADEIRTYLDLGQEASEGWIAYVLDEKYPGWSTETSTGEVSE